ncbi:MAG: shikimate kinase [Saprospiraceae bacterium]|nr:shikimate kinase [Saprospiraceae bacterium]
MSGRRTHIVLIGFMGSGKSTIGKVLAEKLKRPFVDLDESIVQQEGMSISTIFKEKGEDYFRIVEQNVLQSILSQERPIILSTGGGTPCFYDSMDIILSHSFSFYLKVGRKTILQRIQGDKLRPLIASKTKQQVKQFIDMSLQKREHYYLKANQVIRAFNSPQQVANRMLYYLDKKNV